jgi:hypothetical protein
MNSPTYTKPIAPRFNQPLKTNGGDQLWPLLSLTHSYPMAPVLWIRPPHSSSHARPPPPCLPFSHAKFPTRANADSSSHPPTANPEGRVAALQAFIDRPLHALGTQVSARHRHKLTAAVGPLVTMLRPTVPEAGEAALLSLLNLAIREQRCVVRPPAQHRRGLETRGAPAEDEAG